MKQAMFSFDNIISITDLREDIDSLTKRLARYPYTVVFKNRDPFFVAVDPNWFKKEILKKKKEKKHTLAKRQKSASYFNKVAQETGNWQAGDLVIKTREQEKQKWTR